MNEALAPISNGEFLHLMQRAAGRDERAAAVRNVVATKFTEIYGLTVAALAFSDESAPKQELAEMIAVGRDAALEAMRIHAERVAMGMTQMGMLKDAAAYKPPVIEAKTVTVGGSNGEAKSE